MNFYGPNLKIWMWTMLISNKTALRDTEVAKPKLCDLTPLDFFLWGHVKDKVYADASQSIQEIKEKIRAVIDEIEPQMCENVMGNFIKKAWSCKRGRGDHFNDIVFHY